MHISIVMVWFFHTADIYPMYYKIYYLNSGTQNSPGPYGFE